MINDYIKRGAIVPNEVTCGLLLAAMQGPRNLFLIDGYPRNDDNRIGWEKMAGDTVDVKLVLFFDAPEEVLVSRCLERGKTSGRTDDNIESLRMRIQTYNKSTTPVIEYFEQQGIVSRIDADQSIEVCSKAVDAAIAPIMK